MRTIKTKTNKEIIRKTDVPFGRPREHDRNEIFYDLLLWAKDENSTNLLGFCAKHDLAPSKLWNWAEENPDFRQTLDTAKAHIGFRREERLSQGTLHMKAYDLNASTYDYFLKQEKREQAKHEASLKNQQEEVKINLSDIIRMAKDGDLTQK